MTNTNNTRSRGRQNGRHSSKLQKLRIIPLGGLGEIGKNMTVVEYGNEMIIIDCGITFPDEDLPGVDVVIPDISYVVRNQDKLKGILITHGHEDHYGAIPYVLKRIHTNIYCTRLTAGLLQNKYKEFGLSPDNIKYVKAGDTIQLGNFGCEFIRVAHSIPDACAIAVHNPVGTVLFTGDYKFDFTPIDHEPTDIPRLAELGKEGVMALFSDSTNVEHPGYTMSERTVGETFKGIFQQAKGRIIVATFASNLHRVQQIIWAAEANRRHIFLSGRSMINNVGVASELGYLSCKKNTLQDIKDVNSFKDRQVCLLITGTQGEPMSALSRMANDEHRQIHIDENDTVILSASMIPGNEKSIGDMINKLVGKGCNLIYSSLAEVHVSGHACQEELKLMHSLVKEEYFIPAHGETRMLVRHKQLAMEMGLKEDHVLMGGNGTVFEFEKVNGRIKATNNQTVQAGQILVDGLGIGDVGSVVLNDRKRLADDGIITVVVTVDKRSLRLLAGPEIISRGFVYMKDNVDIIDEIKKVVTDTFNKASRNRVSDINYLKTEIREQVKDYVYSQFQRSPIVLSVLMEVDGGRPAGRFVGREGGRPAGNH